MSSKNYLIEKNKILCKSFIAFLLLILVFSCSEKSFLFKKKPKYYSIVDIKYRESLLKIDTSWTRGHFDFPLGFAPSINFQGYEESVYPKYWSDSSSLEFWSYALAWQITQKEILSEKDLETALTSYFNGLMNIDSSRCTISKEKRISKKSIHFGTITTKDALFSRKPLILNIKIEQHYNKKKKKMLVLFKFSPQDFEKEIWVNLNELRLID